MYRQQGERGYDFDYRRHLQQQFQPRPLPYLIHPHAGSHDTVFRPSAALSSSQWDPMNRTQSIDAVVERAQVLAGNINEMAKNARASVERVGEAATRTGALFDDNVGRIGANFQELSTSANSHLGFFGTSSPLLYAVVALLSVVGVLGALLLLAITLQSWLASRRRVAADTRRDRPTNFNGRPRAACR